MQWNDLENRTHEIIHNAEVEQHPSNLETNYHDINQWFGSRQKHTSFHESLNVITDMIFFMIIVLYENGYRY